MADFVPTHAGSTPNHDGLQDTAPDSRRLHGNSSERRAAARLRADLIAHCAGRPSATQMAMIEQATELKLRLAVMDHAFIRTSRRSAHASRDYLAWSNSMVRLLRQLGLRGVSEALDGGALRSAQQAGSRAMTGVCYLTATHSRPNRHQRTETGGIPPFLRAEAPDRLSGVRLNWPAAAPYSALTRVPADLPGSAAPSSMLLASPMTR